MSEGAIDGNIRGWMAEEHQVHRSMMMTGIGMKRRGRFI